MTKWIAVRQKPVRRNILGFRPRYNGKTSFFIMIIRIEIANFLLYYWKKKLNNFLFYYLPHMAHTVLGKYFCLLHLDLFFLSIFCLVYNLVSSLVIKHPIFESSSYYHLNPWYYKKLITDLSYVFVFVIRIKN